LVCFTRIGMFLRVSDCEELVSPSEEKSRHKWV
jgi:hypothetical protein